MVRISSSNSASGPCRPNRGIVLPPADDDPAYVPPSNRPYSELEREWCEMEDIMEARAAGQKLYQQAAAILGPELTALPSDEARDEFWRLMFRSASARFKPRVEPVKPGRPTHFDGVAWIVRDGRTMEMIGGPHRSLEVILDRRPDNPCAVVEQIFGTERKYVWQWLDHLGRWEPLRDGEGFKAVIVKPNSAKPSDGKPLEHHHSPPGPAQPVDREKSKPTGRAAALRAEAAQRVEEALAIAADIRSLAEGLPSRGEDFGLSVLEKTDDIATSIDEAGRVTDNQMTALENMRDALERWYR